MPNYQNGKIYEVHSPSLNQSYFGSTTLKYISSRMSTHRYNVKKNLQFSITPIILAGDYSVTILEKYPCNSRAELTAREQYYIDNYECVNNYFAHGVNMPRLKATKKKHNDKNNPISNAIYNPINNPIYNKIRIKCECGIEHSYKNKSQHLKSKNHKNFIQTNNK
jgi:hypothetical protein